MNKKRPITRGHKTLGAKWLFEPQFSHQSSLYLDSEVAPKSPTFHTATVSTNAKRSYINNLNINNMRKMFFIFLIVFYYNLSFGQVDTESPKLKDIEILPSTLNNGDSLTVQLVITDNLSGVDFIAIFFNSPSSVQYFDIQGGDWMQVNDSTFLGKAKINNWAENGVWFVKQIQITDNATNTYVDFTKENDTIATFAVVSDNEDITPPIIKEINYSPQPIHNDDSLQIELKLIEDASGVDFIATFLKSPSGSQYADIQGSSWIRLNDSIFISKIKINHWAENGRWYVNQIQVLDSAKNTTSVFTQGNDTISTFIVNSDNEDITAPILNGILFSPNPVDNDDSLNIELIVKEEVSGVNFIATFFSSPSGSQYIDIQGNSWIKKNDSTFISKTKINQWAENGNWYLNQIQITDFANNIFVGFTQSGDTLATFSVDSLFIPSKITIYDTIWVYDTIKVTVYDTIHIEKIDTIYITIIDSTGLVSGIQKTENIIVKLYPNPAQKHVIIESPNIIDIIEIYNLQGQLVNSYNINSKEAVFNLENFLTGQYLVKVELQNGKIIIKNMILLE